MTKQIVKILIQILVHNLSHQPIVYNIHYSVIQKSKPLQYHQQYVLNWLKPVNESRFFCQISVDQPQQYSFGTKYCTPDLMYDVNYCVWNVVLRYASNEVNDITAYSCISSL